jgi:hypothetical protein
VRLQPRQKKWRPSFDSRRRSAQNPPKQANYIASTLNTMLPGGFNAYIPGALVIVMARGVETLAENTTIAECRLHRTVVAFPRHATTP